MPFLGNLNLQCLDRVGSLFPKRDHLIVSHPGLAFEEFSVFLEGRRSSEGAFRPLVHNPFNRHPAECASIGQKEAIALADRERV